jgi:hypothetical protein
MNSGKSSHTIVDLLVLILIAGCAKIASPTGGPKDLNPPEIVKSNPVNGVTNFKGDKIVITFNEYVVLDKINEKFMVSPPMKKKPQISLKRKNVIIEYDEELKDSTTYTFYFQDAIRDLNESNPIDNYQFVFSTGPVVDSLSVTGNVYNGFSLDPPEETLVLLYRELADTAVIKQLPAYISRVDKKGYFRIDNVKKGTYRLYALKDGDNSKNFNLADEEFAFMNTPIEVTAENNFLPIVKDTVKVKKPLTKEQKETADTIIRTGEYQLILYKPEKKLHYLTSSTRSQQYKLVYTLSLPPDSLGFNFSVPGYDTNSYFIERSKGNDTIQIWMTDSTLYSKPQINSLVWYPFTDSTGNIVLKQDTILMRFIIPRATRARIKPARFSVNSPFTGGVLIPGQQLLIKSQSPFRAPDTSKIRLYQIIDSIKIKTPFTIEKDKKNSCTLILSAKLIQGKAYLFIADSTAFGNIYGQQADSTGSKFIVRNNDTFGKLTLNISNYEGSRIIQLLTNDEKLVRETKMNKNGKIIFPLLNQGTYKLRVIYDLNNDGKWTTGDFASGRLPEPVSFLPKVILIKENWELDEDWDIGEKNIKKLKIVPTNKPGR